MWGGVGRRSVPHLLTSTLGGLRGSAWRRSLRGCGRCGHDVSAAPRAPLCPRPGREPQDPLSPPCPPVLGPAPTPVTAGPSRSSRPRQEPPRAPPRLGTSWTFLSPPQSSPDPLRVPGLSIEGPPGHGPSVPALSQCPQCLFSLFLRGSRWLPVPPSTLPPPHPFPVAAVPCRSPPWFPVPLTPVRPSSVPL